ncbi:MAG: HU family DNA-binding protein [Anaerolineae bacterium]|nr:HU family DNA-binding protein [Anaerolineae bacterium]
MQKTELIARIAKESGLTQTDTAKVINTFMQVVTDALKSGEKVTLTGFGTFEVRQTAARTGVNPRTRQKLDIPAGKRPSFSAGTLLRDSVSKKG